MRAKGDFKMKQKIWAKTLLSTYNCLEPISDAIDKLVISQGVNSCCNHLSTMENAEKIISLIQRKKMMINLKVIIENVIASIDTKSARILVMKYFDHVKPEMCFKLLEMSRRTFFRKIDRAVEEFAIRLKNFGYTSEKLEQLLFKESWIKEYYNHFAKQKESNICTDEEFEFNSSYTNSLNKCKA